MKDMGGKFQFFPFTTHKSHAVEAGWRTGKRKEVEVGMADERGRWSMITDVTGLAPQ